jgi:hypothetical protein
MALTEKIPAETRQKQWLVGRRRRLRPLTSHRRRSMKVRAKSAHHAPIADDRLGRARSSVELTSQRPGIENYGREAESCQFAVGLPVFHAFRQYPCHLVALRISFLSALLFFLDRFSPPESLARPLALAKLLTACEHPLICQ